MRDVRLFLPSPPMRLLPSKAEVVFYGLTIGRFGLGVIRQTKLNNGEAVSTYRQVEAEELSDGN